MSALCCYKKKLPEIWSQYAKLKSVQAFVDCRILYRMFSMSDIQTHKHHSKNHFSGFKTDTFTKLIFDASDIFSILQIVRK